MEPPRIDPQQPAQRRSTSAPRHRRRARRRSSPAGTGRPEKLTAITAETRSRGVAAARQRAHRVAAEIGEQMPHRRLQQLLLGAEIMMRQRRGHAGAAGDVGHGDVERAALADRRDRRVDQRAAAQRFHSDLRHIEASRPARLFFIDWSINKNPGSDRLCVDRRCYETPVHVHAWTYDRALRHMTQPRQEVAMTACIVGWAHSRFGKLEGETLELPDRQGRRRCARACRHRAGRGRRDRARPFQCRLLAAGFHREPGAAGRRPAALQAGDARRECLRDRLGRGRQGIRAIDAHAARIVLVVGAEQMTTTPGAGDRREPAARLLSAGGWRHAGRFRRRVRQDRAGLFPAPWRPVGRACDDRRQEPQERRRQSLCADAQGSRLRFLPAGEREEPVRRRAAEAHRLLAGLGRRGGDRAGRHRHARSRCAAPSPSAPTSMCRISCRCRSATSCCSRAASRPGRGRWRRPA